MIRPRPFDLERGNRCSEARGRCATTHGVIQLSNDVRPIRDLRQRQQVSAHNRADEKHGKPDQRRGEQRRRRCDPFRRTPAPVRTYPNGNRPPGAARRGAARASAGPVANGYRARRRARAFGSRLSVRSRADVAGRRVEVKRVKLANHRWDTSAVRRARASLWGRGSDGPANPGPAECGVGVFVMTRLHRAGRRPPSAISKEGRRLSCDSSQPRPVAFPRPHWCSGGRCVDWADPRAGSYGCDRWPPAGASAHHVDPCHRRSRRTTVLGWI